MKRLLLVLICLLTAGIVSAQQDPTWLTYASPYSPNHPFSRADQIWMKWVERESDGNLHIKPIWSGALISSDHSLLEVRHGVADIAYIAPIYSRGGTHLLRIQTGFYIGAKTFEQQVAVYRCLAAAFPEYAKEVKGLKILAVQGGPLAGILTCSHPVRSLEDLKGLRIRVPTEMLSMMRELGADPISMPMGDVYSALAKEVIDGVVAPLNTLKALHFAEVAKYYTRIDVPRGAYPSRAMGLKRWKSLSVSQRAVLEASIPVWEAAMAKEIEKSDIAGEEEGRRLGVEFISVSPSDQKRFDDLYITDALKTAKELNRFGIDGEAIFRRTRSIVNNIELTGNVICGGN
jgi:TRAP-type C4-dicarboxylate transport system substrate-binding protein